ncbi:dTMP kinase [Kutzneria sp. NPDC052558]|uniref:dTMP kinase n=1 Tax=Kutzneria sp. NPDC052558 TaxID=3364121 RepID=UPI0037CC172F
MSLRLCSESGSGIFVSVDGPSGAGKTTIVHHLAQLLVAQGEHVYVTVEPSAGPIGKLCHELTETVSGHALACLYAADRYHHLVTEIRPYLAAGDVVISDRYVVVQRFDDIAPDFLWQLNEDVDRPDLTVILDADPDVISERLCKRGPHNRFQLMSGSSHTEVAYYREAAKRLVDAGFEVLRVDCGERPPEQTAASIRDRLLPLLATSKAVRS